MSGAKPERSSRWTWRLWTGALAFLVVLAAFPILRRFPVLTEISPFAFQEDQARPSLMLDAFRSLFLAQIGVGIALLLLVGQLLWNQSLRRAVAVKTRSLQEAEARYRCLIEGLDIGIALLDKEGEFLMCNGCWADLLDTFCPPEIDVDLEEAAALRPWRGEEEEDHEWGLQDICIVSPKGREHILSVRVLLVQEPGDSPLRTIELVEDVTEKRKWEARLRDAERLESMGRMAGGIAHEFRNLLMGMSAGMESLKRSIRPNSKLMPTLNLVLDAGERAKDLVAQLLSFAGKGQQITVELDINQVCQEAANMLVHLAPSPVRVETSLDASPSLVRGDPDEIRRAILNIGMNGEQAIRQEGKVTIATRNCDSVPVQNLFCESPLGGPFIHVLVTDTGEGMSEEVLSRILEPFFTTKKGGTGLGLPMVQGCIRSHGGAFGVESDLGQGTTFHLYFPLSDSATTTDSLSTERPPADDLSQLTETPPETPVEGLRFSVVDDDALTRRSLAELLRAQGNEVEVFEDGPSFLRRYDDNPLAFDFILLDIDMPELRGDKVLDQIRERSPRQKVILCSGSENHLLSRLRADHVHVSVLRKPFDLKRLLREVNRIQRLG